MAKLPHNTYDKCKYYAAKYPIHRPYLPVKGIAKEIAGVATHPRFMAYIQGWVIGWPTILLICPVVARGDAACGTPLSSGSRIRCPTACASATWTATSRGRRRAKGAGREG